jgi:protein SCO1
MNKREFIKSMGGATAGLAAVGAVSSIGSVVAREAVPITPSIAERRRGRFLNVPLVDQDGRIARFYDDLLKDKTVLINFMYARCGDFCPGMTVNLNKVQRELGDRVGKDIFMYSISLEPEHDTPEKLKSYADLFKVKPGWAFLTGTRNDIEALRQNLGFVNKDPELDKDRTRHTGMVKFGIEALERWGGAPAMTNPKYIAEYIRWMEPNGERPNLRELMG